MSIREHCLKNSINFVHYFGDYQILDLDENYQTVLVGEPGRKYLWILARTENISNTEYNRLISKAKSLGFPTENVVKSKRDCQ